MVISNDVFGLTISQFERVYKTCLGRRKTKEQWILNLRYPDKSSKEYLKYLENCTDCNKDLLNWIDSREKYLYDHLVHIVGGEIDIQKRQRLFITQDRIVNSSVLSNCIQIFSGSLAEGLDLPDIGQTIDIANCIRNKDLPHNAIPWIIRHRGQWPPNFVIDRIINYGCLLVPIGHKTVSDIDLLWRVSFSVAEKILVHSFSFTQLLCYGLLKLTLKRIIDTHNAVKGLMCSYFLKTALFWVSETVELDIFQLSKMYHCFSLCLEEIISCVKTCHCPNYFIPEHNMFLGKIDQSNNTILLCVLESIQSGGINGLIQHLFLLGNDHHYLSNTMSESLFVQLDFLLYRNCCYMIDTIRTGILNYYKALSCIENVLNSESSTFIIDACKFYINCISRKIVHLFPLPNAKGDSYSIHKLYHALFKHIIKIDAVSGWLLYASFYYVTGQFKVTLSITDYIQSRLSPYLLMTDTGIINEIHRPQYKCTVHFSMTLEERVTIATEQHVYYGQHSPLIPEELRIEVIFRAMNILPNVMSRCLRFLCYHHLGELSNRQQALNNLYLTVKENDTRSVNTESNALTILGACFDISGDKNMAYQCYEEALQCDEYVCPSAEGRRSKLLEI